MTVPENETTAGKSLQADRPAVVGSTHSMELQQMQIDDIKLPAEIEALQRDPVVYNGQRVMTTELLALAYGTAPENIQMNFARNAARFIDGQHFVKLTGLALREFKNQPTHSGLVGARASHLILWLDRGAARHAKLVETDEAWRVFGKLEDAYFGQGLERVTPSLPVAARVRDAVTVFASYRRLGRLIGLDKNQATLAANEATIRRTGENVLADVGVTHLMAPEQEPILTPTEIGERLGGLSAKRVNLLLVQAGLQASGQGGPSWEPSSAGARYAKWQDTGKKQGGVPIRQLKWLASVVDVLRAEQAA